MLPVGRRIPHVDVEVPDAKEPRYAIPATRSKPTTAIASAARRLKRVLLRDYHSRGGVYSFSESPAFNSDSVTPRRGSGPLGRWLGKRGRRPPARDARGPSSRGSLRSHRGGGPGRPRGSA